jgi:hypothetical protein
MATHEGDDYLWYLGIGSMMSITALGIRGIRPLRSAWCEILDHRRVHYPPHGMATLVQDEDATAHAVAHLITQAELATLLALEPPSVQVRARLHGDSGEAIVDGNVCIARFIDIHGIHFEGACTEDGGQVVAVEQETSGARAYIVRASSNAITVVSHDDVTFDCTGSLILNATELGVPSAITDGSPMSSPPSARYVELMLEGARAVGMDRQVVDEIESITCVPRKSSGELLRLHTDPAVETCHISEMEVRARKDTLAVFRGRVMQKPSGADLFSNRWESEEPLDVALRMSKFFYDPVYGVPPDDPHKAWPGWDFVEDWAARTFTDWRHIGWVSDATAVERLSKL